MSVWSLSPASLQLARIGYIAPMKIWLRLLIVCFIAVALPVQGMAGVSMAHCGSTHERMGTDRHTPPQRHADHDAGVSHQHGAKAAAAAAADDMAGRAAQADPYTATAAKTPSDPLSDLAQYKCSSCATCCAGAALPCSTPRLPELAAAPTVFVEALVTVDALASDGPDRPPRNPLV